MLGGLGVLSQGDHIEKQYTELAAHTALRIQLKFFRIDHWGQEYASVYIDGGLAWRGGPYHNDGTKQCGNVHENDAMYEVDVTVDHRAVNATLRLDTTASKEDEYWGVADVVVGREHHHHALRIPAADGRRGRVAHIP